MLNIALKTMTFASFINSSLIAKFVVKYILIITLKSKLMDYKFIDNNGTFTSNASYPYDLYFPLTNKNGSLLSSISPNLAGDIKKDNDHFLTPPISITDIKTNLLCRRDFFITYNKNIIRLSLPYKDKIEAGFLYHKITKNTKDLSIEILNFIPYNLDVEIMHVKIINKTNRTLSITPPRDVYR